MRESPTRGSGRGLSRYAGKVISYFGCFFLNSRTRRLYECSQDQWDIYKLDPLYDCHVRAYPNLTVISPSLPKPLAPKVGNKRFATPPSPDTSTLSPSPRKRAHIESESSSGEEQEEVEEMIVDDRPMPPGTRIPGLHKRLRVKKDVVKNRKDRREKLARRAERLTKDQHQDDSPFTPVTEPAGKRKSKWVCFL